MYDGPFASLDPISVGMTAKLICWLNDNTMATSVIVSHDVPACISISVHASLLATQGRVVTQGSPDELMASRDPETRQFVHGGADGPVNLDYPAPAIGVVFGLAA